MTKLKKSKLLNYNWEIYKDENNQLIVNFTKDNNKIYNGPIISIQSGELTILRYIQSRSPQIVTIY